MEIEQEKKQGESAPSTAQNKQDDYRVVDEEASDNEEVSTEQKASDDEGQRWEKDVEDDVNKSIDKDNKTSDEFSEASGMSAEAKSSLQHMKFNTPEKGVKRSADAEVEPDSSPMTKRANRQNLKVCVVLDTFPKENLTAEQSKEIQESYMDHILEMGTASTIKPKFINCFIDEHGLTILCADQTTVDWLKIITPTLRPWEGAQLKIVMKNDMPRPVTYVGFLPDSKEYSEEKVLKLLEAQNESFHVQTWKISKREVIDSELQVTFTIDRKFTEELIKAGCKVSYKFGKVQLWPKTEKGPPGSSFDPKLKTKPEFINFRGARAGRSNWRGGSWDRGNWRGRGSSPSRGVYRGAFRSRAGKKQQTSFRGNFSSGRGSTSWQANQ